MSLFSRSGDTGTATVVEPTRESRAERAEALLEAAVRAAEESSYWQLLRRNAFATLKYLTTTEVHTYAFSVAANAILSFFPFIVLLLTLTRRMFHSATMYDVVLQLLRDYLPSNQEFVVRNLQALASGHRVQIFSLVMLFITSTGIFLPLEVALNKIWGIEKNRSYLGNQFVSLALAVGCGTLVLLSVGATAANLHIIAKFIGGDNFVFRAVAYLIMKIFAIAATISAFFLIYWGLPNGRVSARAVIPAAVIVGLISEIAKHVYVLALPWLDFQEVYGPFSISVTLMFWAFLSGLLLLGGAYLSSNELRTEESTPINLRSKQTLT